MKKILLFPGADAIEDDSVRFICARIPAVRDELIYAQNILQHAGINLDLIGFVSRPKVPTSLWFHHLVVATVAVQVAIYKIYVSRYGIPDYILSCSLGDLSRNVCIGSTNYEDSLLGMSDFADAFTKLNCGGSVHATFSKPYSEQTLANLPKFNLASSIMQTPNHILIGGYYDDAVNWIKSEGEIGSVKLRELYPYPLHTILMASCYDKIEKRISNSEIMPWSDTKIYSAVERRFLSHQDQLGPELKTNILSTVYWHQSIKYLAETIPDAHFCNLGPAPTLMYFHKKTLGLEVPISDFFAELKSEYEVKHEIVI